MKTPNDTDMQTKNENIDRQTIRMIVRGAYDIQKLRIETGNRLAANFRAKLGVEAGEKDDQPEKVLDSLEKRYRLITDDIVLVTRKRTFEYDGVISNYTELCLVGHYLDLRAKEVRLFRDLERALKDVPIWKHFLKGVKGCGPAMAGVLISEIDITKARYASSLWKFAGLDVAPDGRGRSRKAEHLEEVEYVNASGENATRRSITFNPFLKTKLVGVLGPAFLRAGESKYRTIYDEYKLRLENHPAHAEKTKGHRHNMAVRYMVKIFLVDLYAAWRTLEGLPVSDTYAEAKLGLKHGHR